MSEFQDKKYDNDVDAETRSVSGFVVDELESVTGEFTQITELPSTGHNTLARAKRYGRWFMLKGLKPEVADEQLIRKSLLKEFDIMMRLDHPGVVQTIGLEDVPGRGLCIVMEWVEGMTLKQWLGQNPSRRESRKMLDQILDAVEYVHSQGVVHRDLKPSNMMVSNVGKQLKLIDFGLADNDSHAVLKQPGGTVEYMAPEQFSGSVPDVRNDIYSLGVMMRKMPLGRKYRGAIMKCLGPIDERFDSVDDLRKYLHRTDNVRRYLLMGLSAALVLALMCVVAWQQMALRRMSHETALIADSLRHQIRQSEDLSQSNRTQMEQTSKETQSHISALNDSLSRLTHDNTVLHEREQSRQARQKEVDAAIAKGEGIVKEALRKTQLEQHIDTVSDRRYLWIDWRDLVNQGRDASYAYVASIKNDYSTKELAEIEYALEEYCAEAERKLMDRLYNKQLIYFTTKYEGKKSVTSSRSQ